MSNIEGRKAGRGLATASIATLVGIAVGVGAMLWLYGGPAPVVTVSPSEAADATSVCGGKVKYYRNPMGTPDTSPVPKKDSMGMDYIPVCEDGEETAGAVKVSLARVQQLGVRSEAVEERALARTVRAFATVQFDERRQFVVAPKFSGWIEKLAVNATGDVVTRGQDLFEAYSPELNILQQQWRVAGRSADATDKLRYLAYPEAALEKLRRGDPPSRTVTFPSPVTGTVLEKIAIEGMHFQPGDALFRIVDTSTMWVLAEIYEQDLAFVKAGDIARVSINAWPERAFEGRVTFIYPSVGKESRTARVRIEVANPDGLLRADMAATVEIAAPLPGRWVAVPDSAILDSGRRQVVLVERGEGLYEPRPVKLGVRVPGYAQVLEGLKPEERVVTQATFLIDAESNIRASLAAFTQGQWAGEAK